VNSFQCRQCMLWPCGKRNKFFINFWNRTILLCMTCNFLKFSIIITDIRNANTILVRNSERKRPFERLSRGKKIMLILFLMSNAKWCRMYSVGSRQRFYWLACCRGHSSRCSGYINDGDFSQGRRVPCMWWKHCFPIEMQPKYFCHFSISKKYFILQNMNHSKNIYYI
jgi:hypothetical protein